MVICLSFMCDGSITSMIPVVTNKVFGTVRGAIVYGYMFSTFGVSAMLGWLFVTVGKESLDYHGMLLICLAFTTCSAIITFFYRFEKISYVELARKIGFETPSESAESKYEAVGSESMPQGNAHTLK